MFAAVFLWLWICAKSGLGLNHNREVEEGKMNTRGLHDNKLQQDVGVRLVSCSLLIELQL